MSGGSGETEPADGGAAYPRSPGMRDLGPAAMRRFRAAEARFLEVAAGAGYAEIRTPTVEPLHLFTGAGALSPRMLDRVYSFLDWDGWSGERVVLRPDSTLPAVRWREERADGGASRLCYVQPVYRFAPGGGQREQWQCGVELFGLAAPEGDAELLRLALGLLSALGAGGVSAELSHGGLVREALAATGLDAAAQLAARDRLLEGDEAVIAELADAHPSQAPALRVLLGVAGEGAGYLANLRAALTAAVPAAEAPIAELEAAARVLGEAAARSASPPPPRATSSTTRASPSASSRAAPSACAAGATTASRRRSGGRTRLAETIGGRPDAASGFAADLLGLAELADGGGEGGEGAP